MFDDMYIFCPKLKVFKCVVYWIKLVWNNIEKIWNSITKNIYQDRQVGK